MPRPQLEPAACGIGPVPNYQPPGAPHATSPPATGSPATSPPATSPLAAATPLPGLAAELEAFHRRALAARADERMQPLALRDRQRLAELVAGLRRLAATCPHPLPDLPEPPAGIALALPDLLPFLAPALLAADQLRTWQRHSVGLR